MLDLTLGFLASVPVGHAVRTYREERLIDSMGWVGAGSAEVLYDFDTGVVFGARDTAVAKSPGEPRPEAPDRRWLPEHEGRVVYCIVVTRGGPGSGHESGMVTYLGIEPPGPIPYR